MKFNFNDHVLFRETQAGAKAFDAFHERLGLDGNDYRAVRLQPDGRLKMPLWEAFQIYGPVVSMGCAIPFERNELELTRGG